MHTVHERYDIYPAETNVNIVLNCVQQQLILIKTRTQVLEIERSNQNSPVTLKIWTSQIWSGPAPLDVIMCRYRQ